MSIETLLKSHVDSLLTGGCHHIVNRTTTQHKPYACFYIISALPENGITEYLGKTRYLIQIDVFATSPEQAKSLGIGDINSAIDAGLNGTLNFHADGQYSEEDRTYQYITQFVIWSDV